MHGVGRMVLRRLAQFTRQQASLRQQIKTALTYPVILVVVGTGVVAFLMLHVIPKFMDIFGRHGVALDEPRAGTNG